MKLATVAIVSAFCGVVIGVTMTPSPAVLLADAQSDLVECRDIVLTQHAFVSHAAMMMDDVVELLLPGGDTVRADTRSLIAAIED